MQIYSYRKVQVNNCKVYWSEEAKMKWSVCCTFLHTHTPIYPYIYACWRACMCSWIVYCCPLLLLKVNQCQRGAQRAGACVDCYDTRDRTHTHQYMHTHLFTRVLSPSKRPLHIQCHMCRSCLLDIYQLFECICRCRVFVIAACLLNASTVKSFVLIGI